MRVREPASHFASVLVLAMTACASTPESAPKIQQVPMNEDLVAQPVLHPHVHVDGLPALTTSWKKTADLIRDPEKRKQVDAFAASTIQPSIGGGAPMPRVESHGIGEGGEPSAIYAGYEAVQAALTHEEAVALLQHENPAVRAYFALGEILAVGQEPDAPYMLYSLFADSTSIQRMDGCMELPTTVNAYVLEQVLAYGQPVLDHDGDRFLKMVITDTRLPPRTRGAALKYLATLDATTAHPMAIAAAQDSDAAWRSEGVRALGVIGDPNDTALITVAGPAAAEFPP